MKRYGIGRLGSIGIGAVPQDDGPLVTHEDAARILAQRDSLAELLREVKTGLDMFGGFPCTCRKIKDALAELDKEKQQCPRA